MKNEMHKITASCACGAKYSLNSTIPHDVSLQRCAQCHPAYTGVENATVESGGAIDKFNARYQKVNS